jgi:hypothetical protein
MNANSSCMHNYVFTVMLKIHFLVSLCVTIYDYSQSRKAFKIIVHEIKGNFIIFSYLQCDLGAIQVGSKFVHV